MSFVFCFVFLMYRAALLSCSELVCARANLNYAIFFDSYNIILTREAALSRSGMKTLHEIALNSYFLCLFATKIETNESWIICEYAHLLESREETISKRNLSSFFAVFVGIFFRHTCGPLPRQMHATFYA